MKIAFFGSRIIDKKFFRESLEGNKIQFIKGRFPDESDAEIISVDTDYKLDKDSLSRFPKLKFIATRSTGFDHIDVEECKKRGILISNDPIYGTEAVAEFTFSLIFNILRKIGKSDELNEKILGAVGAGRIGKMVIMIGKSLGMEILAYDIIKNGADAKEIGFKYVNLDEIFSKSDIISLHAMLTNENYHIINEDSISKMKENVVIINTARGGLIDTEALIKALKEKRIAGAGLDVLEEEEDENNENFIEIKNMENVILTDHIASVTDKTTRKRIANTADNIKSYLRGRPVNVV